MVRIKEKKLKGDEAFKSRKQKIGRKKLAPATSTRAEVHARTLRITAPRQSHGCGGAVDEGGLRRSLEENLGAVRHYRDAVRRSAFKAIAEAARSGAVSSLVRLHCVEAACGALTDTDADVRKIALVGFGALLRSFSSISSETIERILSSINIALTHAIMGVRISGSNALLVLLETHAGVLRINRQHFNAAQLLERVTDVSIRSPEHLRVLVAALQEMLMPRREAVLSPDEVLQYTKSHSLHFIMMWRELMENGRALFRDPARLEKALLCGSWLHIPATFLKANGRLDSETEKVLRDAFLHRVPFTLTEILKGHHKNFVLFGRCIAEGCLPLVEASELAARTVTAYLTFGAVDVGVGSAIRILQSIQEVFPGSCRFVSLLPRILETIGRCFDEGAAPLIVDAIDILQRLFEVKPLALPLEEISSSLLLIPRLLFHVRTAERCYRDRVVLACFALIHEVVSTHPSVMQTLEKDAFAAALQSIFGFSKDDGSEVSGIVDLVDPKIASVGINLFFYLSSLPRSICHGFHPLTHCMSLKSLCGI